MFMELAKLSVPLISCDLFKTYCLSVSYLDFFSDMYQQISHLTLSYGLWTVSTAFVGQLLSKADLAAYALAVSWFNIANETMTGFISASDTLLTQTFGAKQYSNYSVWTGNSLIIVLGAFLVSSAFMALCGPILSLIMSDQAIAGDAGIYATRLIIPGLFPLCWLRILTKYLQTQNILAPTVLIGFLVNGVNVLWNWLFMVKGGFGLAGSAWSTALTAVTQFILVLLYMLYQKDKMLETYGLQLLLRT